VRIAYYDEAGDDGFPRYSSPLFALSAVYMHYLQWHPNFERVREFRRALKRDFGLPVKLEMHTKYFVLGKNPYRPVGLSEPDRIQVMDLFADLIGSLDQAKVLRWMEQMRPSLNTRAAGDDEYGVKVYPR
jgi:Protein of unknown function (DUF3800)